VPAGVSAGPAVAGAVADRRPPHRPVLHGGRIRGAEQQARVRRRDQPRLAGGVAQDDQLVLLRLAVAVDVAPAEHQERPALQPLDDPGGAGAAAATSAKPLRASSQPSSASAKQAMTT
jgi:hypothetical protein